MCYILTCRWEKIVIWLLASFGALIFSSSVFSRETIASRRDLGAALENAVKCMPDALGDFDGSKFDGSQNDLRKIFESLGVRVAVESKHGGEIVYQLPGGINVFGYEASEALYFDESTTLFFIKLRSGSDKLNSISKALRLASIPSGNPDGYGYFNEFDVRFIRKLHDGNDGLPDTIFSGIGEENGRTHIVVGCQNLAW